MSTESITSSLCQRFAAPLPEFYDRRIIFWSDKTGEFEELFDELEIPDVRKIRLTGTNNFEVKKLLLHDDLQNDYLIYDPFYYARPQDDWLLDIRLFSEEYSADYISMTLEEISGQQTAPMRETVREYKKFFENKERKARLQKIGRRYDTPMQLSSDILSVLAGVPGGDDADILRAVLSDDLESESNVPLNNITKFGSIEGFWKMAQRFTGYEHSDEEGEKPLGFFAAHVLITALSHTVSESVLRNIEHFVSPHCAPYCYNLIHEWQRRDDGEILYNICRTVEEELGLAERFNKTDIELLIASDIFPVIDESILLRFFDEAEHQVIRTGAVFSAVEARRTSGWYEKFACYYSCLYHAAQIQEFLEKNADGFRMARPQDVWKFYAETAYTADTAYRRLFCSFEKALEASDSVLDDKLKSLASYIDLLYKRNFLDRLNECWIRTAADDLRESGEIRGIERQRDFYRRYVRPISEKSSRVFVIISDGLRYETAAQLREEIARATKGNARLCAVQSIFPSITSFGMAALLPGSAMAMDREGRVLVDGMSTVGTGDRQKILQKTETNSVAARYDDVLRMTRQQRRELVNGMKVVYIYHNTIDAVGDESKTEKGVFKACEDAVRQLTSLLKLIVNDMQGTEVYITADHGFLYTYSPLDENEKIGREVFDGEVRAIGRRYALTAPETTAQYLLPVNLTGQLQDSRVMGYAPGQTIRIKTGGAGQNYVHGGISLQEMAVPVIHFKNHKAGSKHCVQAAKAGIVLINESRLVSNSIFSLDFLQKEPVGDKVLPCKYEVYMADSAGKAVSDKKTVIADKSDPDENSRLTRLTFTMRPETYRSEEEYRLVIRNDTDIPQEIPFKINISFSDDFGF